MFERVTAKAIAPRRREQRLIIAAAPFRQPLLQQLGSVAPERCAPFLPALALAPDVSSGAQHHVFASQVDQLGDPQSGLKRHEQNSVIPAPDPRRPVGGIEQRLGTIPIDDGGNGPGGLWALIFGNGGNGGIRDVLYFSDGIAGETHGLFAAVAPVPEPSSLALLAAALALFGFRRTLARR